MSIKTQQEEQEGHEWKDEKIMLTSSNAKDETLMEEERKRRGQKIK